ERLPGGGHVAGEARVIHRHGVFAERQVRQREVLRQLEPQLPRRRVVFRAFGEIERARVAVADATRLAEDHLEQRREIALVREGGADSSELGELLVALLLLLTGGAF